MTWYIETWDELQIKKLREEASSSLDSVYPPWVAGTDQLKPRCSVFFVSYINARIFIVKTARHQYFVGCLIVFIQVKKYRIVTRAFVMTLICLLVQSIMTWGNGFTGHKKPFNSSMVIWISSVTYNVFRKPKQRKIKALALFFHGPSLESILVKVSSSHGQFWIFPIN